MNRALTEEDVKKRYIEPALSAKGWDFKKISMEARVLNGEKSTFAPGKIIVKGKQAKRGTPKRADYLLHHHNNFPIAIIEAKDLSHSISDGIQQAMDYAKILDIPFAYSSNGEGFVEHDFFTGRERNLSLDEFPTSDELWERYTKSKGFSKEVEKVVKSKYYAKENGKTPRYYQRIAINRVVEAVAHMQEDDSISKRSLVVMATGTGKTYTAFQFIYRLIETKQVKKVLYLADRNVLIDQSITNDFSYFKDKGSLDKVRNRNLDPAFDVYMALYQQLTGDENFETFRQFSSDFFDLIVVDECHRGSADENSQWRRVLDYFSNAIHIGMTATPKETEDISNSQYFGEPIYTYSLKEGIDDGFLAPYKVFRIGIDKDLEGYIPEQGKLDVYGQKLEQRVYTSKDFDRKLILDQRTLEVARKITDYLKKNDRYAKTIVFCVDQEHADRMRQALVNENSDLCAIDDRYVTRITSDDKAGKEQLDNFADISSKYPTIVTTSELLSTGVDIQMCKVIVIDQIINSMTKFKQIIGRGTRLVWDRDKRFFTILDFRKATLLFSDPEFDGTATSVYVGVSGDDIPTDDEPIDIGEDETDGNEKKYRVADVTAKIISEVELIYGPDGKLVINHSENLKKIIQDIYPTFDSFKSTWMSGNKKEIINSLEEQGVDFSRLQNKIGEDIDIFDVISLTGYGNDAILKSERVSNVINSDFYVSMNNSEKEIIDDLFAIYQKLDVFEIIDIQVFKLKIFEKYGGFIKTVKILGGKEKYKIIINKIVELLYEE